MLVHVMTPAMKAFYKLEKRWVRGEVRAETMCS
jgi:ribosomal silencing factor RsfS